MSNVQIKPNSTELQLETDAALDELTRTANISLEPESEQSSRQLAAYLTVCGWQSAPEAAEVVRCEFCSRRLQLERHFLQSGGGENESAEKHTVRVLHLKRKRSALDSSSSPAAADVKCSHRVARRRALHPLREHRSWCPWVCSYSTTDETLDEAATAESALAVPPLVRGVREGQVFVEHQFRGTSSDPRTQAGFRVLLNCLLS